MKYMYSWDGDLKLLANSIMFCRYNFKGTISSPDCSHISTVVSPIAPIVKEYNVANVDKIIAILICYTEHCWDSKSESFKVRHGVIEVIKSLVSSGAAKVQQSKAG